MTCSNAPYNQHFLFWISPEEILKTGKKKVLIYTSVDELKKITNDLRIHSTSRNLIASMRGE